MRCLLALLFAITLFAAEYPQMGPDIYSPTADAAEDIAVALTLAKSENKHVLLKLGANWCVWCHRLHKLIHEDKDVITALDQNYIFVMVDANSRQGTKRNLATIERYGNPTQYGLPVLVVLDAEGTLLTTQETGALEAGDVHSPAKVIAFLQQWAPQP
jgi:thioredoxin-related protein